MKRLLLAALLIPCAAFAGSGDKSDRGLLPELRLDQSDEDVNQRKAVQSEVLISKSEEKAIAALNNVIKKKKGTPQEPDLWYRMAELYMRRAKSGRFFDLSRGQDDSPVKFAPPEIREESAISNLKQAISIYNKIERDFPKFSDMDSVLFNNGFANQQTNQKHNAELLYARLVEKFPKSSLVPDSHLALGEMAYDAGTFTVALEHFEALQKFKNSKVYSYGLYKAAWTHYNLHQNNEAIQSLLDVVKFFDPSHAHQVRASHNLRSEALRDLALFFGETHSASEAYAFFAKICQPDELGEAMINMGKLYDSHGRQKEMVVFLPEYLKKNPDSPVRVKAQMLLIQANETLKNRPEVVKWMEEAADSCRPKADWREAHKTIADADCDYDLARVGVDMAKKWWEIWLKNKGSKEMAALTEKAFQIHLEAEDPLKPDAKSHYAYAELLFQTEQFREASVQYEFTAAHSNDTQMAHDSAYSAIVSMEKAEAKGLKSGDNDRLLVLCNAYLKKYPNGAQSAQVSYKIGFLAYEAKDYPTAEKWLKPLALAKNTDPSLRTRSQDLELDMLNARKDLNGIRDFAKQVLDQTDSADRRKNLQKIMQEADYNSIQQTLEKDEAESSIQKLVSFYHDSKDSSPLAKDSLWQAMGIAFAKDRPMEGADLALEYAKQYPDDKRTTEALRSAAKYETEQGFLLKAAAVLELLAVRLKGDEQNKTYEAVSEIYNLENRKADAREFLNRLLAVSDKKEQGKIYSKLLATYKGEESSPELSKLEAKVLAANIEPSSSEIRLRQVQAMFKDKKYTEAFNSAKNLVGGDGPNEVRAKARLIQAQVLEQELVQQSTKTSLDHLPVVLSLKTEKLDKTQTAYLSAAKISEDANVQLATLEGLDRVYRNYVDTVGQPILKTELKEDEKKALDGELAKLVNPIREKQQDIEKKLKSLAKSEKTATTSNGVDFASLPVTESVKPQIPELPFERMAPYLPHLTQVADGKTSRETVSGKVSCTTDAKDLHQDLGGLMGLANRCLALKKFSQVEKVVEQIAQAAPKSGLAPYYLSINAELMGLKDKALYLSDLAMKKDKDRPMFWYQRAVTLGATGDHAGANQWMIKAFDEKLDAWEVRLVHGVVAFSQGDCFSVSDDFKSLPSDAASKFQLHEATTECMAQKGEVDVALNQAQKDLDKDHTLSLALQLGHLAEVFKMDSKLAATAYTRAKVLAKDPTVQEWLMHKLNWINNPASVTSNDSSHVSSKVAQDEGSGGR